MHLSVVTLVAALLVCLAGPVGALQCATVKQKYSWNLEQWKARGSYFTFEGHKIFYVDAKSPTVMSGPVLIALHGFPTAGFDFSKMLPGLLTNFSRVVVPDFLGFGFSDKPQYHLYSIFDHADMSEALLKHLGIKEVHVLCHDLGDPVGQAMLDKFNKRKKQHKESSGIIIKTLTLLNGAVLPLDLHPTIIQQAMLVPFFQPFIRILVNYCLYRFGAYPLYGAYYKPNEQDFIDLYLLNAFNNGHRILPLTHNFYREQIKNREMLSNALKAKEVPFQIIQGRQDPVNPYPFERKARKMFPHATIDVLPENGHYCHWEAPEHVTDLYTRFVTKHF